MENDLLATEQCLKEIFSENYDESFGYLIKLYLEEQQSNQKNAMQFKDCLWEDENKSSIFYQNQVAGMV